MFQSPLLSKARTTFLLLNWNYFFYKLLIKIRLGRDTYFGSLIKLEARDLW